jgi:predicted Zn-dependent protease
MLSEQDTRALTERALGHVTAQDAQVVVASSQLSHLRFAANNVATSGRRDDATVTITVWLDRKQGSASTNELDPDSLKAVVAEAERIASVSLVDQEYVPTVGAQKYDTIPGFVPATANIDLAARAKVVNGAILASEAKGVVSAGFHEALGRSVGFATRNGAFGFYRISEVGLSMTARTPVGDGSGYFSRDHVDVAKLDTNRVANEAIRRALESREPRAVEPGEWTVILEAQAVADLLGGLAFAFNARTADEGRSALSAPGGRTRVGEQLFDVRITMRSDPHHPDLPGAPATQDGLPARPFHLVKDGVVTTLVYSRYWAQQKGKEPTPGPVNRIVEGSGPAASVADMIASTKKGLLVGRFFYIRATDPRAAASTGLTRDGVWYIENGRVQHAVKNLRFNQSMIQMLAPGNIEAIGAPERVSSGEGGTAVLMPALTAKRFQFTSQSDAV